MHQDRAITLRGLPLPFHSLNTLIRLPSSCSSSFALLFFSFLDSCHSLFTLHSPEINFEVSCHHLTLKLHGTMSGNGRQLTKALGYSHHTISILLVRTDIDCFSSSKPDQSENVRTRHASKG